MDDNKNIKPLIYIIFGGAGDLSKRKLIPALFALFKSKSLNRETMILAIDKKEYSLEEFKKEARKFLEEYTSYKITDFQWSSFCEHLKYLSLDIKTEGNFKELDNKLKELKEGFSVKDNRIFYMAVSPNLFEAITIGLDREKMIEKETGWQRIMFEKPFGSSLEGAKKFNENITKLIPEEKIFRIDHYLGKEMIQNITAIRFSNRIFESLWSNENIDHVQIHATEEIGIGTRGEYYDKAGIMKDMFQNHIIQMLSLVRMETPKDYSSENIRKEKVNLINSIQLFPEGKINERMVMDQYTKGVKGENSYLEKEGIPPDSVTSTFLASKLNINNKRWQGVPFYIKTGKRLSKKSSIIVIQFKEPSTKLINDKGANSSPNVLVIKIQPNEGIFFQINAKVPGHNFKVDKVKMDYCQLCKYTINSSESYERLLLETAKNNSLLFTSWDESESSWKLSDYLEKIYYDNEKLYYYSGGSKGPEKVDEIIENDKRKWWEDE